MRHLRAIVTEKRVRNLWSVVLCLAQRVINRTWKHSIRAIPNTLVYALPPDMDRGIFEPFGSEKLLNYVAETIPMQRIREAYEHILDATSWYIYEEQQKILSKQKGDTTELTNYPIGSYVLVSYPARPPSKLADRWMGPFSVVSKDKNTYTIRDLTSDKCHTRDISRLKRFVVDTDTDPVDVAARDMSEETVRTILSHKGHPKRRSTLEFEVEWEPDGDITWESWNTMKRTEAINAYLAKFKPHYSIWPSMENLHQSDEGFWGRCYG